MRFALRYGIFGFTTHTATHVSALLRLGHCIEAVGEHDFENSHGTSGLSFHALRCISSLSLPLTRLRIFSSVREMLYGSRIDALLLGSNETLKDLAECVNFETSHSLSTQCDENYSENCSKSGIIHPRAPLRVLVDVKAIDLKDMGPMFCLGLQLRKGFRQTHSPKVTPVPEDASIGSSSIRFHSTLHAPYDPSLQYGSLLSSKIAGTGHFFQFIYTTTLTLPSCVVENQSRVTEIVQENRVEGTCFPFLQMASFLHHFFHRHDPISSLSCITNHTLNSASPQIALPVDNFPDLCDNSAVSDINHNTPISFLVTTESNLQGILTLVPGYGFENLSAKFFCQNGTVHVSPFRGYPAPVEVNYYMFGSAQRRHPISKTFMELMDYTTDVKNSNNLDLRWGNTIYIMHRTEHRLLESYTALKNFSELLEVCILASVLRRVCVQRRTILLPQLMDIKTRSPYWFHHLEFYWKWCWEQGFCLSKPSTE